MTIIILRRCCSIVALAAAPCLAAAQRTPPSAPPPATNAPGPAIGPPIQRIETASAVSKEAFGAISSVRELPDGRVLVNDAQQRRLVMMDSALVSFETLLDSLADRPNSYGSRPGGLIPSVADSTLFIDPVSYAVLVIDPSGRIVKVRSVWRAQDVPYYLGTNGTYGWPGFDARGRAVYRVPGNARDFSPWVPRDVSYTTMSPDSAFVVAVDLGARKVDTLATIRIPKSGSMVQPFAGGMGFSSSSLTNPLPATDEWAVLSDGTVAIVRGQDYRVEYLNPDGSWISSAKLPFEWQRVKDEDKRRMVDSVRTSQLDTRRADFVSATIRWVNQFRQKYPQRFNIPAGYVPPAGFGRDWQLPQGVTLPANYIYGCAAGEEPKAVMPAPGATPGAAPPMPSGGTMTSSSAMGTIVVNTSTPTMPPGALPSCIPAPVVLSGGTVPQPPMLRQPAVIDAEHLPDYRPPFPAGGAVRGDMEGNLWIRTNPMRPIPGGPVYDIVSRQGELVNRIQLPVGYAVVGFGRGKVVFLSTRDATGIHLARVRLR